MYVGGIKSSTKDADIKEHFEKFDEIATYARQKYNKPSDFCFITFKEKGVLDKCLDYPASHIIDDQTVKVNKKYTGTEFPGKKRPIVERTVPCNYSSKITGET